MVSMRCTTSILHMFCAASPSSSQAGRHIAVTITTNITAHLICVNQSIELTCHSDVTSDPVYQWRSSVEQLNWTSSDIVVTASGSVVSYTCTVRSGDREGSDTVSIVSNGEARLIFQCCIWHVI